MEEYSQLFDICIVCALAEEANAVVHEFSDRCENVQFQQALSEKHRYPYRYTTLTNSRAEPLRLLVVGMPFPGPVETALNVRSLLDEFHPRFVAMTGICAGYREKVALGDLVAASYAFYFDEGKVEAGKDGQDTLRPEWRPHGPPSHIIHSLQVFTAWEPTLIEMKERLLGRKLQPAEYPQRFIAPLASSMAVQGNNPFSRLLEGNRKAWFLDQEVAAFYHALHEHPDVSFLAVKSVCDYADSTKNDDYHEYAARASAVYLLRFIQEYVTEETMPRHDALLPPSGIWNVPYLRNQHFTGREELLDLLDRHLEPLAHDAPTTMRRAALTQPQAIEGLGGIGKTQVAVEYAYRVREQGRYTHTFWVNAANEEALITSFTAIAELLPAFPERHEADQQKLVAVILRWLEQCSERWLLIFDNADDVSVIQKYLPKFGNGSILLTTRADAVSSLATPVEVETLSFIEGTHLLLRRAQRFEHASAEEINEAGNVVVALDHFPLALDQAGAYIEETRCSFSTYLQLYQDHRQALLARRGAQATNYPDSVAATWSLSFQRVEQVNPAAAELLQLCSYLSPDRIPEELIRDSAAFWPSLLQQAAADLLTFNQMLEDLLKFSLVKRLSEDNLLSVHRLVQAVQVDRIKLEEQRRWTERVVRAVNTVFPPQPKEDVSSWPQCLRYLEQAQACDALIQQHLLTLPEAADLLSRTGIYLREHASYTLAEPLFLAVLQQAVVPSHYNIAYVFEGYALLQLKRGKLIRSAYNCIQALEIIGIRRFLNDIFECICIYAKRVFKRAIGLSMYSRRESTTCHREALEVIE